MNATSFYLHSNKNRRLYPSNKYILTHLLDYQSIQYRLSKQPTYVKHFKYTFILLIFLTLICTIFFRIHIYIYNSFLGPFHLNFDQFLVHIKDFENGQSWLKRIEYIQIELGEDNIQNSTNKYDTIRRYSDPRTRRNHIATYKKLAKAKVYIKLPTRSQGNFHVQFPFQFSLFSIRTLQCIVRNLPTDMKTWIEKSEYVKYINEQYAQNSTAFNMLVLTKCGILIGYLYRPLYEKAFTLTKEHSFYQHDIAFDAARQYCSYYPLLICTFIFLWLFLKGICYLCIYLSNLIRFRIFHQFGLISFPLYLSSDVIDELWLLNIDGTSDQQLLQLDQLIEQSKHKYNDQLFLVHNHLEELFVVLLQTKLHEDKSLINHNQSPFVICPVTDIKKIVQYGGICYGKDSSWIPWPSTMTEEENYSEWLHEQLMEISEYYQNQYEYRLQHEQGTNSQNSWNGCLDFHSQSTNRHRNRTHRPDRTTERRSAFDWNFKQLIREEENFQRMKLERQRLFERILEPTNPASPKFIAQFRMEQQSNEKLVDSDMEKQDIQCMVCLNELKINEPYGKWPCPLKIPHIFHYECMLNTLRTKNTCPICRHPVENTQTVDHGVSQFLNSLVF